MNLKEIDKEFEELDVALYGNQEDLVQLKQFLHEKIKECCEAVVPRLKVPSVYKRHEDGEKCKGYNECIEQITKNINK